MTSRAPRLWALALSLAGCSPGAGGPQGPSSAVATVCPEGQVLAPGGRCEAAPASSAPASRPRAPVAQREGPAGDLDGQWQGEDSQASALYDLTIEPGGRFVQTITTLNPGLGRPPGSCTQEGEVSVEGGQITWRFSVNTCNTDYEGREASDTISERGPRSFVIVESTYQVHYSRRR